jgi:hypothetical protein
MAKQNINIGSSANKGDGDPLRTAFTKINNNFTELYDAVGLNDGLVNLGSLEFNGSTITTTDSSRIEIAQEVRITSDLTMQGSIVPSINDRFDLGSSSNQWRSLYVSSDTIFIGGVPLAVDNQGNLTVDGNPVQGEGGSITVGDGGSTSVENVTEILINGTITEIEPGVVGITVSGGSSTTELAYLELTNSPFIVQPVVLGTPVSFTRTAEGSETDSIDTGLTLARGSNGALYNTELEAEYDDNNYTSPLGTEWNNDGWGNLVGLATRTYTTFREALNGAVGNNIIGAELVMHDTINDRYYKFSFSNWGGNNGGSFAYTRTLVEDPNYFKKANYATANNVDVIEDDSTLQIGITRGNNQGIYNPFTEEEWDEDVSPDGTEWNIDGWDDLTDVETRTYTTFYNAYDGNVGQNILGSKAVMYVPSIDKYYAIQWLSWTQNNAGGGFSYLRYEIDLTKLDEGVTFADGTVQKTAYIPTNVKLTAPGERRIEEASGYKSVSVTTRTTTDYSGTLSRTSSNFEIFVTRTSELAAVVAPVWNDGASAEFEISLDGGVTYTPASVISFPSTEIWFDIDSNEPIPQVQGDAVSIRITAGGDPVIWWDKDDLPGGSSDFRGAVIDYHAYILGRGTIIGTIHIVDDDGEENITHTEVSSGSSDLEYSDLWYVTTEGEIKYRQLDGDDRTLKIQWTAKVFYGSEYYDD